MVFDTLMGIFDRVGIRKSVHKTVGMFCRPRRVAGVQAYKSYTCRMTGEGRSFKERQRERVLFPECGKEVAKGSLVAHRQTQHKVAKGRLEQEGDEAAGVKNPITYRMAFPAKARPRTCPVKGCSGRALTRTAMMVQFWHRHVRDTVVVLEEGNLPHPR